MRNATLIYNPIAGRHPARRERQIKQAAASLRDAGINVRLQPTWGPGTARELAQAAVKEGNELVLVCGGDGTLNEVMNGLVPSDVTLGILPGGTANILARELDLPRDPVRAARELPRWSARRIAVGLATWPTPSPSRTGPAAPAPQAPRDDAGVAPASPEVSGTELERRYFLSVAGIGFDAYIVNRLAHDFKMSLGVVAYILEALRQAFRYSFPSFTCQTGGRQHLATFAVVHRTSLYAGWLHLAPRASLFEPLFHLCLFKSRHRARYFLYAVSVLARQHLRLKDVELVETTRIECSASESETPIFFELDGESVAQLPATFEIIPNALTLLAP